MTETKKKNEAQIRANAKYDKTHTKGVYLKLNKVNDADIIKFLELHGNTQTLIKELLRDYMAQAYGENYFKD